MQANAKYIRSHINTIYTFNSFNTIIFIILVIHAPLLSYGLILLYFILFSKYIPNFFRKVQSIILILSMSLISASRAFFQTWSDDFNRYYDVYIGLLNGDYSLLFEFGGGLEFVLSFFYLTLGYISNIENPVFVLFSETFLILILFYIWIEKYFINFDKNKKTILIVSSLFFLNLLGTTQLTRQFLSMVILLYAITSINTKKEIVFFLLATFTHLSAIPIYFIIKMIQWKGKFTIFVISIIVLTFVYFLPMILNYGDVLIPGLHKLNYYVDKLNEESTISYREISSFFVVSFSLFLLKYKEVFKLRWDYFFLTFFIIYLALLSLPLASLRATLLFNSIILGTFLFVAFQRYILVFKILLSLYIIYRVVMWSYLDSDNVFRFWESYNWVGTPYYYVLEEK